MENNKADELMKSLAELPESVQKAFAWLITHYEIALEICSAGELSEEPREEIKKSAMEKNEPILWLLTDLETLLHSHEYQDKQE